MTNSNNETEALSNTMVDSSDQSTYDDPADIAGEDVEITPEVLHRANTNIESLAEQERIARVISGIDEEKLAEVEIPPMGGGRDYPPMLPEKDLYYVDFDGPDDPLHPHNWPLRKKMLAFIALGFGTFTLVFGSAVYSSSVNSVAQVFHVAPVVATLGLSLYVLGFASGPIVWAPLSEIYGRKPILMMSSFGLTVFSFACATAENLQTLLICRFFSAFVGAAPLAVVAAAFADMFGNVTRGRALVIFSALVFVGPVTSPIAGGFINKSYLGWRWTLYITAICGAASLALCTFLYEETYHPLILSRKAELIRRKTGNWGVRSKHEEFSLSIQEIVEKNITRPLYMLVREPILLFISIYNGFIYALLYMLFGAYPVIFQGKYHMAEGVADLPFIAVAIGMVTGSGFCFWYERIYVRRFIARGCKIIPEDRLPPMIVGAVCFPIGIMWLCWTGNYADRIHWIVPTISGVFTGFGLVTIFLPSLNYIVDSYLLFAASAIAANTFLRSAMGAAFPMFTVFMFNGMGVNFAGLLIGLVGFALTPMPVIFYFYGARIRKRSKYAF